MRWEERENLQKLSGRDLLIQNYNSAIFAKILICLWRYSKIHQYQVTKFGQLNKLPLVCGGGVAHMTICGCLCGKPV